MYRHRDIDESFAPGFIVGLCFSNNYKDMLAVLNDKYFRHLKKRNRLNEN